jgi:hypothetical protein
MGLRLDSSSVRIRGIVIMLSPFYAYNIAPLSALVKV